MAEQWNRSPLFSTHCVKRAQYTLCHTGFNTVSTYITICSFNWSIWLCCLDLPLVQHCWLLVRLRIWFACKFYLFILALTYIASSLTQWEALQVTSVCLISFAVYLFMMISWLFSQSIDLENVSHVIQMILWLFSWHYKQRVCFRLKYLYNYWREPVSTFASHIHVCLRAKLFII